MTSMYDTIMDLPLFKGISADNLSLLLEKTSVEFLNYTAGERIFSSGETVKSLDFIIKGRVQASYMVEGYDICLKEILGAGIVMGATRLYGIETTHCADVEALEPSSVIRISKEQYINILKSDEIYLINYLNFLAAASQRPQNYLLHSFLPSDGHISNLLGMMIKTTISPLAEEIIISGSDAHIATMLGVDIKDWELWKSESANKGIIAIEPNKVVIAKRKVQAI